MARRLTTFSKLLIVIGIVLGLFFLVRAFLGGGNPFANLNLPGSDDSAPNTTSESKSDGNSSNADVVNIGVVTWGGYAGGQYFNEGFDANTKSRFYKDYGFKVNFEVLDDFDASRAAWKRGDVDLLWTTIDAFPTEAGGLADYQPQVVFQADWSRGGDAIVARRGINKVKDLKGKKIAVAEMTPSHSFLLWLLEAGQLSITDVEIVGQSNAIDAAQAFKSQQVDAAVVWSPDDEACLSAVPGSRILESTRSASNIIADVFIAKKAYVDQHPKRMQQLYEGWMRGAAEINNSDAAKKKAAAILAQNFEGVDEAWAYQAINNVRLTTHGDNQNFFGLNTDYSGVTGESLYSRMTNVYAGLGYIDGGAPNWRLIANSELVRNTTALSGPQHNAEGAKAFKPVNETEGKQKEAIASKAVRINFRTGEFKLDENAKYIIDLEFIEIAKAFGNARIRIEGNTDNSGSRATNLALSKQRAMAVKNYLVGEHKMDPNRFTVVGNGPDKPIATNATEAGKAQNRRTDFELIRD